MREWQDISTAPKDGTDILTFGEHHKIPFAAYYISKEYLMEEYGDEDYMEEGWYAHPGYDFHSDVMINATHWQPLPPPPETHPRAD